MAQGAVLIYVAKRSRKLTMCRTYISVGKYYQILRSPLKVDCSPLLVSIKLHVVPEGKDGK